MKNAKAETQRAVTKLVQKKAQLTVIEKLNDALDDLMKDTACNYQVVGKKSEQARNWKTDELLWEDEEKTIPKYENKYDYVEIPAEELTDDKLALILAISNMRKQLDDLI